MTQAMKPKKIPERKCLGCGKSAPKKELLRVVRSPEGEVSLDFTGKKSGRGAYICPCAACLKKAVKSKRLSSNLSCEIPEQVLAQLESEIESHQG